MKSTTEKSWEVWWYAGICLLVNSTNDVNFLIVDLFWTNIKMGILAV